jgi:hypothetical protein
MGSWVYEYTAYGELLRQRAPITASPYWTVKLDYDEAGRISSNGESGFVAALTT